MCSRADERTMVADWWEEKKTKQKNSCTNNTQLLQIQQQLLRLMDIIWIPDHIFSKIYWSTKIFTINSVQIASKFINLIMVNSSLYDLCLTKQLIKHFMANKNNEWNKWLHKYKLIHTALFCIFFKCLPLSSCVLYIH